MAHAGIRSPLGALVCVLLGVACGNNPEAVQAPVEELLGTQQSALCAGVSVTTLSIADISTYQGLMSGNGNWGVSPYANAVRLEYFVDGVLQASEERCAANSSGYCTGAGTWYFSKLNVACGSRSFLVRAFPMIIDSAGNRTTCWDSPRSGSQSVTEECPATGSPFQCASVDDLRQGCYGIAGRAASYCASISDFNDRQMCYGLANASQQPCTTMTDRNMQLACYGMSIKWPSNCRDITDVNMKNFCYGVSYLNGTYCNSITHRDTQLLCYGMSNRIGSNCRDIVNNNERQFCYGVSTNLTSYCTGIQ